MVKKKKEQLEWWKILLMIVGGIILLLIFLIGTTIFTNWQNKPTQYNKDLIHSCADDCGDTFRVCDAYAPSLVEFENCQLKLDICINECGDEYEMRKERGL